MGNKIKKFLLTLIVLLLAGNLAWGATYNIGPGETYETFLAFHAAVTPSAGDIIDGGGNTFTEIVYPNGSGSAGNPIIYQNFTCDASNTRTPFAGPDGNGEYTNALVFDPGILFSDDVMLVKGTVTSLGGDEWGWDSGTIYLGFDPSSNTIRIGYRSYGVRITNQDYVSVINVTVLKARSKGIFVDGATPDNIIIDNCTVTYCVEQCIANSGGDNFIARNNTVIGGIVGVHYSSGGIQSKNGDNASIHNNEVSFTKYGVQIGGTALTEAVTVGSIYENNIHDLGINQAAYVAADWQGIELTGDATYSMDGISVYRNTVTGVAGAAIGTYQADSNEIYYNVISNSGLVKWSDAAINEGGISLWSGSASNVVYNNTLYNCRDGLFIPTGNNNDNVLKNNNVVTIENRGIFISSGSSGNTSDYNNLYDITGDSWADTATKGANSLEVDPLFVNAAVNNFRLQSGSPAIDAGVLIAAFHVAGWQDYEGKTRLYGSGVDIGAIERMKFIESMHMYLPSYMFPVYADWYVAP